MLSEDGVPELQNVVAVGGGVVAVELLESDSVYLPNLPLSSCAPLMFERPPMF